jgi:phage-related protein
VVKKVVWVGSSYKDLLDFPHPVRRAMGHALFSAQKSKMHPHAKVLSGMGSAGIQEIRENDGSGTYRVIYTVETKDYVFVLHAFQKKSKRVLPHLSRSSSF